MCFFLSAFLIFPKVVAMFRYIRSPFSLLSMLLSFGRMYILSGHWRIYFRSFIKIDIQYMCCGTGGGCCFLLLIKFLVQFHSIFFLSFSSHGLLQQLHPLWFLIRNWDTFFFYIYEYSILLLYSLWFLYCCCAWWTVEAWETVDYDLTHSSKRMESFFSSFFSVVVCGLNNTANINYNEAQQQYTENKKQNTMQ